MSECTCRGTFVLAPEGGNVRVPGPVIFGPCHAKAKYVKELVTNQRNARHQLDLIADRVKEGLLDKREVDRTLELIEAARKLLQEIATEEQSEG